MLQLPFVGRSGSRTSLNCFLRECEKKPNPQTEGVGLEAPVRGTGRGQWSKPSRVYWTLGVLELGAVVLGVLPCMRWRNACMRAIRALIASRTIAFWSALNVA